MASFTIEFNSTLPHPGPLKIYVATGVKISANVQWAMLLLSNDSSVNLVCTPSVNKVVSPMPKHQLKHLLEDVKADNTKVKKLQELQVPKKLGGEVDIILGIAHNNIYP